MSLLSAPTSGRNVPYLGRVRGGPPGSKRWITYPDPYFDIAGTYLPDSVKSLFMWCRYYSMSDPMIAAAIQSMAEYPITPIVVDASNKGVRKLWERYFEEELMLRSRLIDIGLHYMTYGNAFLSMFFAFTKMLVCQKCSNTVPAKNTKFKYRNHRFETVCTVCGHRGPAEPYDQPHKTTKGARLILWEPDSLDVEFNEITGDYRYFYTPPMEITNAVKLGNRDLVTQLPQNFLESIRRKVRLEIARDNLYHLRRPTMLESRKSKGLGAPLVLPVLKQIFHIALMRKAQEAILAEKILPFQVIYPQQSASNVNPYEMINLRQWRTTVIEEINKWRRDPLYMAVMPLPLGYQSIGGEARALLMSQEIRSEYEMVLAGMGVPSEFLFGGLSYSGSNVSLRMMENRFLVYRSGLAQMVRRFIIPRTAARMGWPTVEAHFKAFKMADDLQRKAFLLELNNLKKISDATLLQETDLNPEEEDQQLQRETTRRLETLKSQQVAEAEIMGEVQELQARYQAKAEHAMAEEQRQMAQGVHGMAPGEPGAVGPQQPVQPGPPGQAPQAGVEQIVAQIQNMAPDQQQATLQRIEAQNPELAQHIRAQLGGGGGGGGGSAGLPLPEQLPPRRDASSAMI